LYCIPRSRVCRAEFYRYSLISSLITHRGPHHSLTAGHNIIHTTPLFAISVKGSVKIYALSALSVRGGTELRKIIHVDHIACTLYSYCTVRSLRIQFPPRNARGVFLAEAGQTSDLRYSEFRHHHEPCEMVCDLRPTLLCSGWRLLIYTYDSPVQKSELNGTESLPSS
jgi:hypothetical protein